MEISDFGMQSNKSTNKMAANESQIKLKFCYVKTNFYFKPNAGKISDAGLKVARTVPEKHDYFLYSLLNTPLDVGK